MGVRPAATTYPLFWFCCSTAPQSRPDKQPPARLVGVGSRSLVMTKRSSCGSQHLDLPLRVSCSRMVLCRAVGTCASSQIWNCALSDTPPLELPRCVPMWQGRPHQSFVLGLVAVQPVHPYHRCCHCRCRCFHHQHHLYCHRCCCCCCPDQVLCQLLYASGG